ncbi:hypothetical protein Q8A73_017828 [Channa argus]|nr:hypothetical protein Q8A73_017828 [Channa argus]
MISFLFFCCLSGVGLGVVVRQFPPEFITNPGQKVQIFCSHDKTDYRVMYCSLFLCCLAGVCLGLEVRQSPSELISKPGDRVHIHCSHDKTDYRVMLWYQRSPGDTAMKLIGYLNFKAVTMEKPYEEDFSLAGDLSGTGISLGIQVDQSPPAVFKKPGDDVELVCTHGPNDYRVMLWYQQLPGDTALKLVGYGYLEFKSDSVEEPFRKHFKLAGDLSGEKKKNGSLSISDLKPLEHTATYFCAASKPQHIKPPSALYKNLSLCRSAECG